MDKVSDRRLANIGFANRAEAVAFAEEKGIRLARGKAGDAGMYLSAYYKNLENAWHAQKDVEYIESLQPVVMESLQQNRNTPKIGSYRLDHGTEYEINGKTYKLTLTDDLAADLIEGAMNPTRRTRIAQVVKLVYARPDDEGNPKTYYRTRGEALIRGLRGLDGSEYYISSTRTVLLSIKIKNIQMKNQNNRVEGGFFPYTVKTGKERYEPLLAIKDKLARYQIFYSDSEQGKDNCFVYALNMWGKLTEDELQAIKFAVKGSPDAVPIKVVDSFSAKYNIKITVRSLKNSSETRTVTYGSDTFDRKVTIGLIENHYFLIEDSGISRYAIKNYNRLSSNKNWWTITKEVSGKPIRQKERTADSFKIIQELINQKLVEPIFTTQTSLSLTNRYNIDDSTLILNNKDEIESYKPYEVVERFRFKPSLTDNKWTSITLYTEDKPISVKIAFDFESTTDGVNHEAYMVCYAIYVDNVQHGQVHTITTDDCALDFLTEVNNSVNRIVKDILLDHGVKIDIQSKDFYKAKSSFFEFTMFAHNITYDMHFIIKHIKNYNPVVRAGSNVCGGSFHFGGTRFLLKDTLAIITFGLAKFKDIFKFDDNQGKEILPYDLYTTDTVKEFDQPIQKALSYIKPEDHEQFLSNIATWKLIRNTTNFDHIKYAEIYCKRDVEVMMKGYFKFREWVLGDRSDPNAMHIDIDDKLTISSISDEFFAKEGAYEGCYKINGIARYFIQKSVIGGRCMAAENNMYVINKQLNDFDAVSLYPSAMKRLADIGGYLKGTPNVIKNSNLNMEFLNKQSGYFIEVTIKTIPKPLRFPLISFINDSGVREFTNDLTTCDTFYFNKIGFEDAIKYHELTPNDYVINKGYYFNEGRNPKIGESIDKVFNMRLRLKSEKNPAETLYKLIMNSSYGKTIMKEQSTRSVYKNTKEEFYDYVSLNYNHIIEAVKIDGCDKYLITVNKPISDHFNACHIGSEILSMSKRIMNEVMTLAEDNNIDIYYQDTDSMHINNNKVAKLAALFKKIHNRELIGKSMGQFHCDFEPHNGKDALYSVKTIILGKKSYYDKVYYGDNLYNDHFRMKGIPPQVVIHTAKKIAETARIPGDTRSDIEILYEYLYEGNSVNFNLLSCGVKFKKSKDGTICNVKKFDRCLSFNTEEETDECDEC